MESLIRGRNSSAVERRRPNSKRSLLAAPIAYPQVAGARRSEHHATIPTVALLRLTSGDHRRVNAAAVHQKAPSGTVNICLVILESAGFFALCQPCQFLTYALRMYVSEEFRVNGPRAHEG